MARDKNDPSEDVKAPAVGGAPVNPPGDSQAPLNTSLDEVLDLLAEEVERLKVSLEFYRLSEHPDKEQLIRWVVQQIDMRQDRLEDIKSMILARDDDAVH